MVDGVTVVTVAHGRHDHLHAQEALLPKGFRRVVVAMDDPDITSTGIVVAMVAGDDLPLAAARNAGVRRAFDDGADAVVLLDVDVLLAPAATDCYVDALRRRPDAVLSGPVAYLPPAPGSDLGAYPPHPGRPAPPPGELVENDRPELFWSLSFAVTRATWERVGGFDEGYVGYGAEDTDLALRCRERGVPLLWVGGAVGHHQHHPPAHRDERHAAAMVRNGQRFAERWGRWPMADWFADLARRGIVERDGDGWALSPVAAAVGPGRAPLR